MPSLYKRIEEKSKQAGYKNITELCKVANVARSVMTELNKGRSSTLSLPNGAKIAAACHISIEELYGEYFPAERKAEAATSSQLSDARQELIELVKNMDEEQVIKWLELIRTIKNK